uniref:Cystatin domain-containing protein n=1 Tax=Solanum lycopersicum TaxID=4081 RepID=A0A3Q7GRR9_SOLLC
MSIKFNSILVTLLVVFATVLLHVSEVQGGRKIVINGDDWVDISNLQDPEIVKLGKFAIREINKKAKATLVFLKVLSGQSQINSINFQLMISALDHDSPHYYKVVVSDKEQGKSMKLNSFVECTKFDEYIYMCSDFVDKDTKSDPSI